MPRNTASTTRTGALRYEPRTVGWPSKRSRCAQATAYSARRGRSPGSRRGATSLSAGSPGAPKNSARSTGRTSISSSAEKEPRWRKAARSLLSGKLAADEGTIVYLATPDATLGDDVVVKGWKRPASRALRFDDIPLVVDVSLDLGDRLKFSGEGIETRLAGAVRVTTGPAGLVGKGSDSRGARHLLRVRPAARHRPRRNSSSMGRSTTRASTSWRCGETSRSRRAWRSPER